MPIARLGYFQLLYIFSCPFQRSIKHRNLCQRNSKFAIQRALVKNMFLETKTVTKEQHFREFSTELKQYEYAIQHALKTFLTVYRLSLFNKYFWAFLCKFIVGLKYDQINLWTFTPPGWLVFSLPLVLLQIPYSIVQYIYTKYGTEEQYLYTTRKNIVQKIQRCVN